jgi:acetyl-CoA acyltransferase
MYTPILLDVIRSPFGKYHGGLSTVRADDLLSKLLVALQHRNPWLNSTPNLTVQHLLVGCANQAGEDSRNIARLSSLLAGYPIETVATTLNQLCGSSSMALQHATALIQAGMADIIVVGGVENMSRSPLVHLPLAYQTPHETNPISSVFGWRFSNPQFATIAEGRYFHSMAETAEALALQHSITPTIQTAISLQSHQRAIHAQQLPLFQQGIIPIQHTSGTCLQDECPRAGLTETSLQRLPKLHPTFPNASLTAGTCSPFADGAGVALLVAPHIATQLGSIKHPLHLTLSGINSTGVHPQQMGLGASVAITKVLAQQQLTPENITCWELHEPFAATHALVCQALQQHWQAPNINTWGGSLALGAPMGTIGLRVLWHLAWQLQQQAILTPHKTLLGVGGISIGMGQGTAFSLQTPSNKP